jgi:PAS domain S-box-containing protein
MKVIETLEQVGDRLQIAMVVGSVPTDGSGNIAILFANNAAATLFGYPSGPTMKGVDVLSLMQDQYGVGHRAHVDGYVSRGHKSATGIMGSWRNLEALRKDGQVIPVQANVADIRNSEERYFVAVFRDRSEEVRQARQLEQALDEAHHLQAMADRARQEAEKMHLEADEARKSAEDGLLKQKRLSGQIMLLRHIFMGTIGLVIMLGVLIATQWLTGRADPDGLAMVERVLLVLTGILGSAMAAVFDSRNRSGD